MNETVTVPQSQENKRRFGFFDAAICALLITSVALYDVRIVFLGLQVIAFGMTFVHMLVNLKHTKGILTCYVVWLLGFASYGLISGLWAAPENSTALHVTLSIIQVGLITVCILYYCIVTRNLQWILYAFIGAALVSCVRFFISVPSSMWGQAERFENYGIFGSNVPAMVMAYSSVILVWMCFFAEKKLRHKLPALAMVALFMFISMLMGTKKSLLIFAICVMLFLLGSAKNPVKFVGRIFLIGAALVVGYLMVMNVPMLYNSIGYRIENVVGFVSGGEADTSTVDRADHVVAALNQFSKHPVFGLGQDGYRYTNAKITYSHNNYVELLANLGIVGFVIFYSVYVALLKASVSIFKRNMLPLCFVVAILISDIAVVSYASELGYVLLGIIFSIVATYSIDDASKNDQKLQIDNTDDSNMGTI